MTLSDATTLRNDLVDQLCRWQVVVTPRVEHALRAVPRHEFIPEAPLEKAYEDNAFITKRKADGSSSSSASAPTIVAWQLEQLEVAEGDRVLEIGAGTGYSAALLSELVGANGEVTTVDFDAEVAERARLSLQASGYDRVRIGCGDGEFGYAAHAPYDRIIVATGAWDLPPAWGTQIVPGGRLVVPLRFPGCAMSVGFDRVDDGWHGVSTRTLGFIPMDGAGGHAMRLVEICGRDVTLRIEDDRELDQAELAAVWRRPRAEAWPGVVVDNGTDWDHLYLWLSTVEPGLCKMNVSRDAIRNGVVTPTQGWGGTAVHAGNNIAYLTNRRANESASRFPYQVGIFAHGPCGRELAAKVAAEISEWDSNWRRTTTAQIDAYPIGVDPPTDVFVIQKRHSAFGIRFLEK